MQFKHEKLKRLLKEKQWTLQDLADHAGKSKSYWGQLCTGVKKNPHDDTVRALCDAFKIDRDYFYFDDSRLLQDVIPDLDPDIVDFIMNGENTVWLRTVVDAKQKGYSPQTLKIILDAINNKSE